MASAKKTASGKWATRIFVGYKYVDGIRKREYRQFTADTRKEVLMLAAECQANHKEDRKKMSLHDAIKSYIDLKEAALSPTTIRNYHSILKNRFCGEFGNTDINDITSSDLQMFISDLSSSVGPKTVKNIVTLATGAIKLFREDFVPNITYPARPKYLTHIPSEEDMKKLLETIRGTKLEAPVLLAAFIPARASEVCALTADDLEGNVLHIRKALVLNRHGDWITKSTPKTDSSNRDVILPGFVIDRLPKEGKLCQYLPPTLPKVLGQACDEAGIQRFRFHDLRHFGASIMKGTMGFSDAVVMQRGGWETDHVLRSTYMHAIDKDVVQAAADLEERFSYLINKK